MCVPISAKLSVLKSVLVLSAGDLARRTGLSHSDVDSLVVAVSEAVVHHSIPVSSALQLYRDKLDTPNHGGWSGTSAWAGVAS